MREFEDYSMFENMDPYSIYLMDQEYRELNSLLSFYNGELRKEILWLKRINRKLNRELNEKIETLSLPQITLQEL